MRRRLALLLVGTVLAGCNGARLAPRVALKAPAVQPASTDAWSLVCTDPNDPTPALLSNGIIGVRIGRDGMGLGSDGKTLPAFAITSYEQSGEEKLVGLENPLAARWEFQGKAIDFKPGSEYRQEVIGPDTVGFLGEGAGGTYEIHTTWTWGRSTVDRYTRFLAGEHGVECVTFLTGGYPRPIVMNVVRLPSAASHWKWTEEQSGQPLSIGSTANGALIGRVTASLSSAIRASSANRRDPLSEAPSERFRLSQARPTHPRRVIPTITVDGPIEDQRAINSFIYYIWGSTHPEANRPPGPFGLSNERYIGHVFWDADIWLFPALCLLDPDRAKVIPTYRLRMADAARAQAKAWIESCRRTAYKAVSAPLPATAAKALMYPWESSVSGRETSATKTRFEHHITGDVLWGLTQAEALGLADPDKVRPVAEGCKAFWEARSRKGSDGLFRIEGLISPDENSICDNDLYTNLLAQWTRNGRSFDGPIRYALPHDATGFLTYDKDLLRSYEQATAVLAIYPLQYPPAEAQARAMMDRFESKISQNGPAMSDAIHSIIWARLGDQEKAYDRWRRSWQDFTKGPLMLFSERRNKSVTYFTTGAAGCLQAVLYGFAGFRIDSHPVPKAAWTRRLKGGMWLSVRPCLPQAWRSLTIRNFTVLGHRYTLNVTHERATVSPGD